MDKVTELATKLGPLYRQYKLLDFSAWATAKDIEARQLDITPTGDELKALGSNEKAQQTALKKLYAADETLANLTRATYDERYRLAEIGGEIEALEAERRAEEWRIRARQCDALEQRHIAQNSHGDRVEEGFDDALQAQMDQEAFHEAMAAQALGEVGDDTIPF